MKRVVITSPGEAVVRHVPVPDPGHDHLLVAVRACGICTWEQRVFRGDRPQYPFAGGHEIGGVVTRAADGGPAPGAQVAVSRLPRCGRCLACRSGRDNLCAYLAGAEADADGPGGFAEYVVAKPADVVPVAQERDAVEAALVEPLACVLNSLHSARVSDGSRLAVIGNGFMGLLHARAAEALGARPTLYETGPPPAGLEETWAGEVRTLPASSADHGPLGNGDAEFDAAIVIRHVRESLGAAGRIVRPGGAVSVFASQPSDEDIALPSQVVRKKELVLTAAASHRSRDFLAAAALVSTGAVQVGDLVHRRFSLDAAAQALSYSTGRDTGRVMVTSDAPV